MKSPIVGIELQGCGIHPAAWRRDDSRAEQVLAAAYWHHLIRTAERAGLDFAVVVDSFALQDAPGGERGWLDAAGVAATVAPVTSAIGLIPQISVTHTEPFHVSKSVASLDFASAGRAGWEVTVAPGEAQARLFGRGPEQPLPALWRESADVVEVVTALWDSWEDDAEIRDIATGRFVERAKLHYIDFVGEHFSVKGPSITPRPPQGQPIVVVRADDDAAAEVAVAHADIVRIADRSRASTLRSAVRGVGREPGDVAVLLDVAVHLAPTRECAIADVDELNSWLPTQFPGTVEFVGTAKGLADLIDEVVDSGDADGIVARPLANAATLAELPGLSLPPTTRATLRERVGLARPASRYATVRNSR